MSVQGSTRINKALTNISVLYKNEDYIAGKILMDVPVIKESDVYWIYDSNKRLPETFRANGSSANMDNYAMSTSSYSLTEHAIKDVITDRDYANTDAPLNLERDITEYLTDKIMLRQEYEAHKLLFTTTTFSNNATLTSATSWKYHTTTSAPIQNILSSTGKILDSSGKMPNKGITNWDVFAALKENPNLYNRIQYVERAIITKQLLASLFDLDVVEVGTAVIDSAQEGETESIDSVWGADFLVGYFSPRVSLRDATSAVNMRYAPKGQPYRVKKWRDEDVEGNYIEVQTMFKHVAVATACGYLFKSAAL